MKKFSLALIFISILFMNTACGTNLSRDSFSQRMDQIVTDSLQLESTNYQNRNKAYYSYYLPTYLGHRSASKSSDILVCENTSVLMSLNASAVISSNYYKDETVFLDTVIDENAFYSKTFPCRDAFGNVMHLLVNVYEVESDYYLVVRTRYFYYLAKSTLSELLDLTRDVITIAKTTSINSDAIIMAYSSREVINYEQQETISVFTQTAPENGTLEEMLVDYIRQYDDEDSEISEFDKYEDYKDILEE